MVGMSLSRDTVLAATGRPPGREFSGVASSGLLVELELDEHSSSSRDPRTGELFADLVALRSFFFLLKGEVQPRLLLSSDPDRGLLDGRKASFQLEFFSCGIADEAFEDPMATVTGRADSREYTTKLGRCFLLVMMRAGKHPAHSRRARQELNRRRLGFGGRREGKLK